MTARTDDIARRLERASAHLGHALAEFAAVEPYAPGPVSAVMAALLAHVRTRPAPRRPSLDQPAVDRAVARLADDALAELLRDDPGPDVEPDRERAIGRALDRALESLP